MNQKIRFGWDVYGAVMVLIAVVALLIHYAIVRSECDGRGGVLVRTVFAVTCLPTGKP